MRVRVRRIVLACAAVLVLCGLGAVGLFRAHLWLPSGLQSPVALGGPFTLTASDGRPVTDRSFLGKWLLIYFGYTYCPDVCPTTLNQIGEALSRLGTLADQVTPIFITIDPARDTPRVMGRYVKSFGPSFVGLTGTAAQIARVAREFRVYVKKEPTGKGPDDYLMDHSSIIYVMDPKGHYVTILSGEAKPGQIADRLRALISRSS